MNRRHYNAAQVVKALNKIGYKKLNLHDIKEDEIYCFTITKIIPVCRSDKEFSNLEFKLITNENEYFGSTEFRYTTNKRNKSVSVNQIPKWVEDRFGIKIEEPKNANHFIEMVNKTDFNLPQELKVIKRKKGFEWNPKDDENLLLEETIKELGL